MGLFEGEIHIHNFFKSELGPNHESLHQPILWHLQWLFHTTLGLFKFWDPQVEHWLC